jgi:hypothetical protein
MFARIQGCQGANALRWHAPTGTRHPTSTVHCDNRPQEVESEQCSSYATRRALPEMRLINVDTYGIERFEGDACRNMQS